MDWSKLDAGLAGALADDAGHRYSVFIHLVAGDPDVSDVLVALGVDAAGVGVVLTATVSAADVDRLSDRAEVSRLRLSSPLRLAGGG